MIEHQPAGHAASSDRRANPVLGRRLAEAVALAIELHAEQARKGTPIPYLGHLLGVCGLVIDAGGSEDEAIAAVLHDAVEDQGGAPTLERIRALFGVQVAFIVEACSDTDKTPKPPWRTRKETYIAGLRDAPPSVLRVSAADKLNNLRSIVRDYRELGERLWERFDPESDPIWYYGALLDVYESRFPGPLAGELRQTYDELLQLLGPHRLDA